MSDDRLPTVGAPATEPMNVSDASPNWDRVNAAAAAIRSGNTTAEEEMQRFRHVPVVGRLPWRRQYLVAACALALAMVVLIQQAISQAHQASASGELAAAHLVLRSAVDTIDTQAQQSKSAQGANAGEISVGIGNGETALLHLAPEESGALHDAWSQLKKAAQALPSATQAVQPIALAAQNISQTLDERLPPLTAAASTITDAEAQAVYADLRRWQAAASDMALHGRSLLPRATTDRVDMETRLRAFFATGAGSAHDARAVFWNGLFQAFLQVRTPIDQILAAQGNWSDAAQAAWEVHQAGQAVQRLLDKSAPSESGIGNHFGVWLGGLLSLMCLGLLMWISWKQQHWQALQARADSEKLQGGMFDLVQQLQQVGRGNLKAQSKVSDPAVGAVAESINHTVNELRSLVQKVQATVIKTAAVSARAEQTSSALGEDVRRQAQGMVSSSQDILKLVRALKSVAAAADQSGALANKIHQAAHEGGSSAAEAGDYLQEVRTRVEDALHRVRRLGEGGQQSTEQAGTLLDLSERIGLLAVQADLYAVRAGESGEGFAVVAKGMRSLAEQSTEASMRLHTLTETGRSEIEGIIQVIETANSKNEELARLNDVNHEAWLSVGEQIDGLSNQTSELAQKVREQQPIAENLEHRTQESLELGEETRQRVQDASRTVEELTQVVQELGAGARRFQA
jgi:methyl-accepting chemotaxis protein